PDRLAGSGRAGILAACARVSVLRSVAERRAAGVALGTRRALAFFGTATRTARCRGRPRRRHEAGTVSRPGGGRRADGAHDALLDAQAQAQAPQVVESDIRPRLSVRAR